MPERPGFPYELRCVAAIAIAIGVAAMVSCADQAIRRSESMANDQGAIKLRDALAIDSVLPIRDGAEVKEIERRRVENKGLAKKQKKWELGRDGMGSFASLACFGLRRRLASVELVEASERRAESANKVRGVDEVRIGKRSRAMVKRDEVKSVVMATAKVKVTVKVTTEKEAEKLRGKKEC
ncbi:uncharacterized protein UDID_17055 [Ustilago sp. UG-2017a]|nr:uncharacterized protein UDID_17055 [Ustilago sp. UG-2017a]